MWLCCCQINVKTIQATAIILKRSPKFYEFGLCFIQWGWLKLVGRCENCGADGIACLAGGAKHWPFWPLAWHVWHIMEWQVGMSLSVSMVWLLSQFGINPFVRILLDWPKSWSVAGAMSLIPLWPIWLCWMVHRSAVIHRPYVGTRFVVMEQCTTHCTSCVCYQLWNKQDKLALDTVKFFFISLLFVCSELLFFCKSTWTSFNNISTSMVSIS